MYSITKRIPPQLNIYIFLNFLSFSLQKKEMDRVQIKRDVPAFCA